MPSLKNTNIKMVNTNAVPVSFWRRMSAIGTPIIIKRIIWFRRFSILKPTEPINFATANAVANLANSDGCTPKEPIPNHALFPPTSLPIKGTSTSINKIKPKMT
jgi:hypothetical protein